MVCIRCVDQLGLYTQSTSHSALFCTAFRKQKAGNDMQQTTKSAASTGAQRSIRAAADMHDDQDCLFLSGVRLHLCCCTPEEQLQLVRIAREGCALRHTDLSPGLTHIVVSTGWHDLHCPSTCPLAMNLIIHLINHLIHLISTLSTSLSTSRLYCMQEFFVPLATNELELVCACMSLIEHRHIVGDEQGSRAAFAVDPSPDSVYAAGWE